MYNLLRYVEEKLKIAKVKPLLKKGNQSSFTNYRPISLLPSISKIFEHVMTSQLMEYFIQKSVLFATIWF